MLNLLRDWRDSHEDVLKLYFLNLIRIILMKILTHFREDFKTLPCNKAFLLLTADFDLSNSTKSYYTLNL